MQVVRCSALAASASILQELQPAPQAAAGRPQLAQDDAEEETSPKQVSRALCILDGPIQVRFLPCAVIC